MQVWASVFPFLRFLIVCVCSPKAHGFSVIEHNPASLNNKSHWTRKCTGSPAGRESNSRWYRIGSVEIQHELKARHWRLLMMFLWNYTGCPQLTEHSTATDDDDDELLLWRFFFFFFPPRCVAVYPCACVHACGLTRRTCQNLIVGNELRWGKKKKKKNFGRACSLWLIISKAQTCQNIVETHFCRLLYGKTASNQDTARERGVTHGGEQGQR